MNKKAIVERLNSIGVVLFAIYFITCFLKYGTIHSANKSTILSYIMLTGFILTVPQMIYQFIHFKKYKADNIGFIIFIAVIVFIAIIYL